MEKSENNSYHEQFRESILYSGAGQMLDRLMRMAVAVVVIRLLTQELYGIYTLLLGSASVLGLLVSWGWPTVYMRYIPKFKSEGKRDLITSLIIRGFLTRSVLAFFSILVVILFFEELGAFLNIAAYKEYFILFSVGIFSYIITNILIIIVNAHLDHKQTYRVMLAVRFIKHLVLLFVILLGGGLEGLLIVETIGWLVLGIILARYILINIIDTSQKFLVQVPQKIRHFRLFSFLNRTGEFFLGTTIDRFIIVKYLGVQAVALYTVATILPKRITQFMPTTLLSNAIEPYFFQQYSKNPTEETLDRYFKLLLKINYFMLIPVFVFFIFWGEFSLALIFGNQYREAYPYLIGLSVFYFFERLPLTYVTQAIEKMEINAFSKIIAVYNFTLGIILIQRMGLIGMVIATVSSMMLQTIYIFIHIRRYVRLTIPIGSLSFLLFSSLFVIGGVSAVSTYLGIGSIFSLIPLILLGLIYAWWILRSHYYFTTADKQFLKRISLTLAGKYNQIVEKAWSIIE